MIHFSAAVALVVSLWGVATNLHGHQESNKALVDMKKKVIQVHDVAHQSHQMMHEHSNQVNFHATWWFQISSNQERFDKIHNAAIKVQQEMILDPTNTKLKKKFDNIGQLPPGKEMYFGTLRFPVSYVNVSCQHAKDANFLAKQREISADSCHDIDNTMKKAGAVYPIDSPPKCMVSNDTDYLDRHCKWGVHVQYLAQAFFVCQTNTLHLHTGVSELYFNAKKRRYLTDVKKDLILQAGDFSTKVTTSCVFGGGVTEEQKEQKAAAGNFKILSETATKKLQGEHEPSSAQQMLLDALNNVKDALNNAVNDTKAKMHVDFCGPLPLGVSSACNTVKGSMWLLFSMPFQVVWSIYDHSSAEEINQNLLFVQVFCFLMFWFLLSVFIKWAYNKAGYLCSATKAVIDIILFTIMVVMVITIIAYLFQLYKSEAHNAVAQAWASVAQLGCTATVVFYMLYYGRDSTMKHDEKNAEKKKQGEENEEEASKTEDERTSRRKTRFGDHENFTGRLSAPQTKKPWFGNPATFARNHTRAIYVIWIIFALVGMMYLLSTSSHKGVNLFCFAVFWVFFLFVLPMMGVCYLRGINREVRQEVRGAVRGATANGDGPASGWTSGHTAEEFVSVDVRPNVVV